FPDGAPADTCVKKRANQPNHGQARYPLDGHKVFKGFFIQARDADSNQWIGNWHQSDNTKSIPECSAITHSDNKDKIGATLIWIAPQHKKGKVYFT
uniref:Reelin domain-containing protein n=1 Tax=Megaselia scalaris TaxID=36166 RepID=T1H6E1_MEGSC